MDNDDCHVFFISYLFGFIYIYMLSPNSSGFLTLLVSASNLASLGAVWSREGLGDIFVASGCWLLVSVEVQLYQVPRGHPSIHLSFFSPWFSGASHSHLSLERNVGSSTSVGLVSGLTGWWLVVGSSATSLKCHI